MPELFIKIGEEAAAFLSPLKWGVFESLGRIALLRLL
jgi:hypothetical protein